PTLLPLSRLALALKQFLRTKCSLAKPEKAHNTHIHHRQHHIPPPMLEARLQRLVFGRLFIWDAVQQCADLAYRGDTGVSCIKDCDAEIRFWRIGLAVCGRRFPDVIRYAEWCFGHRNRRSSQG